MQRERLTPERKPLTPERIRLFKRREGAKQSFLWDTLAPRLAVRATAGAKSFVFEGKLERQTIRCTIGDVRNWILEDARVEARRLQALIDQGIDPREQKAERIAAAEAKRGAAKKQAAPARDTWDLYIESMRPEWGERHFINHMKNAQPGGERITRGRKKGQGELSRPGILFDLLAERLVDITPARVAKWLEVSNLRGATQTAQAFRQLRAFLSWCGEQSAYKDLVSTGACTAKDVRKRVKPAATKEGDCLQREQLSLWFQAVRTIRNPVHRNFLQIALLTGARLEELSSARWDGVDFEWRSIVIRDKVAGERTIPMTPYVRALLLDLHGINQGRAVEPLAFLRSSAVTSGTRQPSPWVFFSDRSADGRAQGLLATLRKATDEVGLPHVSIHGLRRSFGTLAEWVECPAGISAQIMGHAPSALAEKHYRRRPLDLLRMWHVKIEGWILNEAGIERPTEDQAPGLRVVA